MLYRLQVKFRDFPNITTVDCPHIMPLIKNFNSLMLNHREDIEKISIELIQRKDITKSNLIKAFFNFGAY